MFKRKPVLYNPISRSNNYSKKSIYRYNKKTKGKNGNFKYKGSLMLIVGILLSLIGTFATLSRTIVYTPMRFINPKSGTSFAISAIVLFLGVILVAINYKSIIGYLLIGVGVAIVCISILLSLRMAFSQTSLISTIFIFSSIIIGLVFSIKGIKSIIG